MPGRFPILRAPPSPAVPAALVLEAPRRATAAVLGRMAPLFLAPERRLYVADGFNGFDPYAFSLEARRRGLREDVLDRIFVTRAFTIHQLEAVTREMFPPLLGGDAPLVIAVLGLDHLFLEESLCAAERARVLRRVIGDLESLRRGGARLVVTHEAVPPGQPWWRPLLEFGDVRARMVPDGEDEWMPRIERCNDGTDPADIQYLAAGRDRLVEGVPPGSAGGAASGV
ncbi:hypothetical protein HZA57_09225 [Candidatus Poribacteria bacterium]|nr:hypothetical protein [Candidatus Poribacteria bacterium]